MSTDQPTLDEFADRTRPENARTKPPAWVGMETSGENQCQSCLSHVSDDFIRVMAGEDGKVHACPRCATTTELSRGAAVESDSS